MQRRRRRNVLVILLGVGALFFITIVGSNLDAILPQHPTATNQVVQAGPYQITLVVSPNPPHITTPADLKIQIVKTTTRQLVTNAVVVLEDNMETMDMGTDRAQAKRQDDGTYLAHPQFTMSGPWKVNVLITVPGAQAINVEFEVVAQ
jgi:YtkA-like